MRYSQLVLLFAALAFVGAMVASAESAVPATAETLKPKPKPKHDWLNAKLSFAARLGAAAEERARHRVTYDGSGYKLVYPMGDVPADRAFGGTGRRGCKVKSPCANPQNSHSNAFKTSAAKASIAKRALLPSKPRRTMTIPRAGTTTIYCPRLPCADNVPSGNP